jgi:hypothetical protein
MKYRVDVCTSVLRNLWSKCGQKIGDSGRRSGLAVGVSVVLD